MREEPYLDTIRFFRNGNLLTVVTRHFHPDAEYVANTHVLIDPSDIKSNPVAPWVELTKHEFAKAEKEIEKALKRHRDDIRKSERNVLKSIYDEAVAIGFSEASARRMSGYVD